MISLSYLGRTADQLLRVQNSVGGYGITAKRLHGIRLQLQNTEHERKKEKKGTLNVFFTAKIDRLPCRSGASYFWGEPERARHQRGLRMDNIVRGVDRKRT